MKQTQGFTRYLMIKGCAKSTVTGYNRVTRRFLQWTIQQHKDYRNLSQDDIMEYIKYLKHANTNLSVNMALNIIEKYYTYLNHRSKIKVANPVTGIRLINAEYKKLYPPLSREQLDDLYSKHPYKTTIDKRNRVILGFVIYQGMFTNDIKRLKLKDVSVEKALVSIPGSATTNSRNLKLDAAQMLHIDEYIKKVRPRLLQTTWKESDDFIVSRGQGKDAKQVFRLMMLRISRINPEIHSLKHIRSSVLTLWAKQYHIRQVQYMAGHKHASSTEKYVSINIEDLQQMVEQMDPLNDEKAETLIKPRA